MDICAAGIEQPEAVSACPVLIQIGEQI